MHHFLVFLFNSLKLNTTVTIFIWACLCVATSQVPETAPFQDPSVVQVEEEPKEREVTIDAEARKFWPGEEIEKNNLTRRIRINCRTDLWIFPYIISIYCWWFSDLLCFGSLSWKGFGMAGWGVSQHVTTGHFKAFKASRSEEKERTKRAKRSSKRILVSYGLLTWNQKTPPWKRRNIYKPPVFGFHVSFRGCIVSPIVSYLKCQFMVHLSWFFSSKLVRMFVHFSGSKKASVMESCPRGSLRNMLQGGGEDWWVKK